ncbi:HECT-like ubiquitin-conjugating enzyme-binding-domain-containing protein [Collybia nuda]|uniref:HECT-like ubiquitin-conjugating enzyme-binding-domain-containing protein n=1 Tax=Collybia nuda TaxID=64659 RepID=A0A9P6C9V6_9AGAR|nr:HECT-like ubiquitin-conjugating enzyme-binding-domain-containing protein [Collybia nuda]
MATLIRPKTASRPVTTPLLTSEIPTPFPREELHLEQESSQHPYVELDVEAGPSSFEAGNAKDSTAQGVLHEIMPSIIHVQKSCLMTLNNLLSMPTRWNPIVPDRRHSMPSSPHASTASPADVESSSSALQVLVSNLRNRDGNGEMIQFNASASDSELFQELHTRVEHITSTLDPDDAILAKALVTLLSHFNRLSEIHVNSSQSITHSTKANSWETGESSPSVDLFDTLKRQLSGLQLERLSSQPEILVPGAPPVLVVEAALLWTRIDEELEAVVAMCKERTDNLSRLSLEHLPPQYDPAGYQFDTPPEYEVGSRSSVEEKAHAYSPVATARHVDEKMRLDLEGVAMAIDRLYLVAPQLHNQRVELKSTKLEQMEKASKEGGKISPSLLQKKKERDIQELENIFDLLGKASERSMTSQSVILRDGLPGQMEKTRLRDVAKKEAFVEQLAEHSSAGRFHEQDASQPRTKDPHTLLSLPEFIRESLPPGTRVEDPRALLTLPEFVKEPPPVHVDDSEVELPEIPNLKSKKKLRHRSLSAPSLSWLRSSSSKSGTSSSGSGSSDSNSHSRSRSRANNVIPSVPNIGFEVHYVAENHENLHHVLVFFTVTGATPGIDIEAEVLPPFPESHTEGGDRLIIRSGAQNSLPLILPARSLPGKAEVKVQSGHYEIKLSTVSRPSSSQEDPPPLLDASQLLSANPTSFICASCSLPLVQSSKIKEYRDLPSEHWQELVDAWMCHTDQKLNEQVTRHGQGGFWPRPDQGLVGGSYILFEESSMTRNNLHLAELPKRGEDWRLVRCICGAVIGRCQEHQTGDNTKPLVYRLLKFAIRPVSTSRDPVKTPLSAFIIEDMIEFVQAHASYRFVILDEEDECPRILIWLFKPSLRLAYTIPTPYAIPKSASIHAAKVLYKVMGPTEHTADLTSILNKYPGFPQAEYIYYPMPICRRLAGLLRESNSAYPESMRMMTGLQVGWLHRA